MVQFLTEYGVFLAKSITIIGLIVMGIIAIIQSIAEAADGEKEEGKGDIKVHSLNEKIEAMKTALHKAVLSEPAWKAEVRETKRKKKEKTRQAKKSQKRPEGVQARDGRVYVLNFHGDMKASAVEAFRLEVTAVLSLAEAMDEVVIRLSSAGGLVHAYGLAASQVKRIRDRGVPLTVCVDTVAASGGYMMACVADKLMAAPFAIIGSIGVVAQIPNFHRLLKKNDIDVELITAGEYKRTLTLFGENTDKGREKFTEDVQSTQELFKDFISQSRPDVDIEKVATGEHWYGTQAVELALVDELMTSDEYLVSRSEDCDVFEVVYHRKKTFSERFAHIAEGSLDRVLLRWVSRLQRPHVAD